MVNSGLQLIKDASSTFQSLGMDFEAHESMPPLF